MPTTAIPEHIMSRTPTVSGARAVLPSTNAWISDMPTMAVAIWTKNRMPTVTAIFLLDMTTPWVERRDIPMGGDVGGAVVPRR